MRYNFLHYARTLRLNQSETEAVWVVQLEQDAVHGTGVNEIQMNIKEQVAQGHNGITWNWSHKRENYKNCPASFIGTEELFPFLDLLDDAHSILQPLTTSQSVTKKDLRSALSQLWQVVDELLSGKSRAGHWVWEPKSKNRRKAWKPHFAGIRLL